MRGDFLFCQMTGADCVICCFFDSQKVEIGRYRNHIESDKAEKNGGQKNGNFCSESHRELLSIIVCITWYIRNSQEKSCIYWDHASKNFELTREGIDAILE